MNRVKSFNQFMNESREEEDYSHLLDRDTLFFLDAVCITTPHGKPKDYRVNSDKSVDVYGDLYIAEVMLRSNIKDERILNKFLHMEHFPVKFNKIKGFLTVNNLPDLKDLEGSPDEATKVSIQGCLSLTTLKGAPKKVIIAGGKGGVYMVRHCPITTLEGCATVVEGGVFFQGLTELESLEHMPQTMKGTLTLMDCPKLTSLKGLKNTSGCDEIEITRCAKINPTEKKLLKLGADLFFKWIKSTMSVKDFLHQKRGTIKGNEFGF